MNNDVDQGIRFGTWSDSTSRLLYHDIMPVLLNGIDTSGRVGDLGGGNGLLREWFTKLVTIDNDVTKQPDIVDDILTHVGTYDLIVLRYVLHYLTDEQVSALLEPLCSYLNGPFLVIQFVNDNVFDKQRNSVNEVKFFRTEYQLLRLLAPTPSTTTSWRVLDRKRVDYRVQAEFYRNRLGNPGGYAHDEAVVGLLLTQEKS